MLYGYLCKISWCLDIPIVFLHVHSLHSIIHTMGAKKIGSTHQMYTKTQAVYNELYVGIVYT